MNNTILKIRTGSHLYGTNLSTSDEDFLGIFLPSEEFVFGLQNVKVVDQSQVSKGADGKNTQDAVDYQMYEFRNFVRLALDNNPNILSSLFVNKENTVSVNEIGQSLLDKRFDFLSKNILNRYCGYSFSQKHKMVVKPENYKKLESFIEFTKENTENFKYAIELKGLEPCPFLEVKEGFITIGDLNFSFGTSYKNVVSKIENRLEKATHRKDMFLKYGYDLKFGMNLIRLLLEAKELLSTGNLEFPLKDRLFLKAIREGKYTKENIIEFADDLEKEINELEKTTKLPSKPKTKEIEKFVIEVMKKHYIRKERKKMRN